MTRSHPASTLFPYTTLFRSVLGGLCVLRLLSEDGIYLDPRSTAGGPESVEIANVSHRVARWRADEGLPGHLLETGQPILIDRKSTRLNSSHMSISYAVFCLK